MLDWEQYNELEPIQMQQGFWLYLRKNCDYSRKRFIYRVAETNELDYLSRFNFSDLVCFDVGSNIGYWTVYLGVRLQAKQVHCFEPDPILFSILEKNISLNKIKSSVIANEYAVGNDEKNIELFILPEHSGDNRPYFIEGRSSISVQSTSIDKYVKKNRIDKVDFIKIDIQGGESNALDGCIETLLHCKPVLMVEFSEKTALDGGAALKSRLANLHKLYGEKSLRIVKNNTLISIDVNHLDFFEGNVFLAVENSWLN